MWLYVTRGFAGKTKLLPPTRGQMCPRTRASSSRARKKRVGAYSEDRLEKLRSLRAPPNEEGRLLLEVAGRGLDGGGSGGILLARLALP